MTDYRKKIPSTDKDIIPFGTKQISLDSLRTLLRTISYIQEGQKFNSSNCSIIESNFFSSIERFWTGETRQNYYTFLKDLVTAVKFCIEKEEDYGLLYHDLQEFREGINRSRTTYINDKSFVAKLDILLSNIDNMLNALER